MHDILIIGGGPAGLTSAIYGLRAGKTVLVIEKGGFGGQIAYSPKVENIPGFAEISGAEFADKLTEQAMGLGADVGLETVVSLEKTENGFAAITEEGSRFEGKTAILALGVKHRTLGLPGEEALIGNGISFCAVCDGAFYAGQHAAMIGGGNGKICRLDMLYKCALPPASNRWSENTRSTRAKALKILGLGVILSFGETVYSPKNNLSFLIIFFTNLTINLKNGGSV